MMDTSYYVILVILLTSWLAEITSGEIDVENIQAYDNQIPGFEIGTVETYISDLTSVSHIEVDLRQPSSILISTRTSLISFNTKSKLNSSIPNSPRGDVEFDFITGFTQLDANTIVVIDSGSDCLKLIDRSTKQVSEYAGLCGTYGFLDGIGEKAKFNTPYSIVVDRRDERNLIVTDQSNNALRGVTAVGANVTTLISNMPKSPNAIAWNEMKNSTVFITCQCSLVEADLNSGSILNLRSVCLEQNIIIHLFDEILLMGNYDDGKLLIYNINSSVHSFCPTSSLSSREDLSCDTIPTQTLLHVNDQIYIGNANGVQKMSVWIDGETCVLPERLNDERLLLHDNLSVTYECPLLLSEKKNNKLTCDLETLEWTGNIDDLCRYWSMVLIFLSLATPATIGSVWLFWRLFRQDDLKICGRRVKPRRTYGICLFITISLAVPQYYIIAKIYLSIPENWQIVLLVIISTESFLMLFLMKKPGIGIEQQEISRQICSRLFLCAYAACGYASKLCPIKTRKPKPEKDESIFAKLIEEHPLSRKHVSQLSQYSQESYIIPWRQEQVKRRGLVLFNKYGRDEGEFKAVDEAKIMEESFEMAGINTTTKEWSDANELRGIIAESIDRFGKSGMSLLIVSVMSHGRVGMLTGTNFSSVPISDVIHTITKEVPSDLPLIIIIQACQSYKDQLLAKDGYFDARKTGAPETPQIEMSRPHTLLLMSSVAGGLAERGVYTKALASQIAKADGKMTIEEMAKSAKVIMNKDSIGDSYKQTPEDRSTLLKILRLPPKVGNKKPALASSTDGLLQQLVEDRSETKV